MELKCQFFAVEDHVVQKKDLFYGPQEYEASAYFGLNYWCSNLLCDQEQGCYTNHKN